MPVTQFNLATGQRAERKLLINYVTEREIGRKDKTMADLGENAFKPIETQEELNNIIKDRLKRERESTEKRFEGYISPEEHAKAIAESNKAFDDYKRLTRETRHLSKTLRQRTNHTRLHR